MHPLKKIISILLLLALGLNTSAYYFYLKVRQSKIRKEMKMMIKAGVPEDELTIIYHTETNAHEFSWVHSREFSYRGMMYDVVHEESNEPGVRILHCVTDHQETALFVNLNRLVKQTAQSHPAAKKANVLLSMFMSGLYFNEDAKQENFRTSSFIVWPEPGEGYKQPAAHTFSPPPKVNCLS